MSERRGKSFISKTITAVVVFLFFGFVIVVVIPNFIRATYQSAANACINNLRQIDAAAQEFGLEKGKKAGDAIHYPDDLTPYIKLDSNGDPPKCPAGGTYTIDRIGDEPKCSIGPAAWPNDHVLSFTNNWWTDFKMAYGKVLGLNNGLREPRSGNRQ
jgi:type II secretory pathway pseudopilin PulG